MDTQVRTPQIIFNQPQRLVVPLFQRPYVWNEENQWEPLWSDVVRVAERILTAPGQKQYPHFLGAVVLQQVQSQTGMMQARTIIDGQQRLTTLQLLMDALQSQLALVGATLPAKRLESLVVNGEEYCARPEDRFKVWPTNRDREAFNAVMAARPPIDYDGMPHRAERMVGAHQYFAEQAAEWLLREGQEHVHARAEALEVSVRDLLQLVVIDLTVEENAQEIFETLNARGAQLTAADLIKNFVFQRLLETGADVEQAYEDHWREFETGFWEAEVSVGRLRYPRSSLFLNHWLVAKTGEEVVAREVFDRFKRFALADSDRSMPEMVRQVHRASTAYREFVVASNQTGPVDRLALFGYRTGVLESEVIKPLVLHLFDPELRPVPEAQVAKVLEAVESWMVRRMLVRATTKSYTQIVAELVTKGQRSDRERFGDVVAEFFAGQASQSRYWPDDAEVREALAELQAYRRLQRGRLRMVMEAIEDHLRGWTERKAGLGDERVSRGKFHIEHVMPRKWSTNWPLPEGTTESEREALLHTIGNLTLLTGRLNAKVSNGAWLGDGGKRDGVNQHDVLLLNRELVKQAGDTWDENQIRDRTKALTEVILQIWPVPAGHRSGFVSSRPRVRRKVDITDLLSAERLTPGMSLHPRQRKHSNRVGTLLPDGRIEVDERLFGSPSQAAAYITGGSVNGWWFFMTDPKQKVSLRAVRREYINDLHGDEDDDEPEDGRDDDEL
ncbi:MAG: DUF262 domain-containing protein [Gemmatimonadales bacterium]